MLAVGPDNPLIRRGAEYRTQQVNFSAEPGETALGFWWQREQSTWHYGADNPTFDGPGSGDPDVAVARFASSYGINVWEPDELSLCDDVSQIQSSASAITGIVNANMFGPPESVFWAIGDTLHEFLSNGSTNSIDGSDPGNGWGNIGSLASDGSMLWILDNTADSLWGYGDVAGDNTGPRQAVELYTGMPNATQSNIIRYAKQRIIAGYDNELYEITHRTTTTVFAGTPFFEHPKLGWTWTDVCEGPGAIYASGYLGSKSAIYKFVLEQDGALPSLSAGILALEMPAGEIIYKMFPYLGVFIGLGTSEGVRICSFADTDIALAPLTYESELPVSGLTGWSDYLYAAVADAGEGFAGLIRIDLSKEIEPGRFAWANDMRANTSATEFVGVTTATAPGRVTTLLGRPVFMVNGSGVFCRQNTRRAPYGALTSGRMLFGMTDRKHFLRIAMSGTGGGSATLLTGVDSSEANLPQTTVDFSQLNDVDLLMSGLAGSSLTIGLTLTRDVSDLNLGPTVTSYRAKALPAQSREEQWILPLRCYDRTELGSGATDYGIARDKIAALREMVRTQEPVLLQTFFGDPVNDWTSTVVSVSNFEYRQVQAEPSASWGGILTVDLATLGG